MPDDDLLSCIICKKVLRDPVLLQCLHNACKLCMEGEAVKHGHNNITCMACQVVTDITTASNNILISAQVLQLSAQKGADVCALCPKDGNTHEVANAWCIQCQLSLCDGCRSEHRKHNQQHKCVTLEETSNWSELLRFPSRSCPEHGAEIQLACFTCEQAFCIQCAASCYKAAHDVQLLGDAETGKRLVKIKESIEQLVAACAISSDVLHRHIRLPEDLQSARDIHLDTLKTAKKAVIDAVSSAYDNAESALKACYDTLQVKASEYRCAAELQNQRVSCGSRYGRLASSSSDAVGLLSQLNILRSHLQAMTKELSGIKEPLEATGLVHMNVRLPPDLEMIIGAWMGLPKLCTEDPCCAPDALVVFDDEIGYVAKEEQLEKQRKDHEDKVRKQQDQYSLQLQEQLEQLQKEQKLLDEKEQFLMTLEALHSPLTFGSTSSSWQFQGNCWDVAVTAEGGVLLAALQHGMKEYDASWNELSCWKPTAKQNSGAGDSVSTVDVLDDGRVAVGVYYAKLVVLLRRSCAGDGSWIEDKRLPVLQSPPRRLSVHADLLAVAEGYGPQPQQGGPQLVIVKLCCGQLCIRKPDYDIGSVAVTAQLVVTASDSQVRLSNGSEKFVVDGYSHSGDQLWRHEPHNKVMDVCCSSFGRVLYLAVAGNDVVTAINLDDGQHVKDVIACSSHGLKSLYGLSLSRGKQRFLVVLSCDEKGVACKLAVYPVSSSS